jgi:ferredoxin-NADP reductase
MMGEGQLIRELRKWVKTVYVPECTYHRETFPPQEEADTTSSSFLKYDQSQERHILK